MISFFCLSIAHQAAYYADLKDILILTAKLAAKKRYNGFCFGMNDLIYKELIFFLAA